MTSRTVLADAAKKVASELRLRGFRQARLKFVRPGEEVVSLIEFQMSRSGTADYSTFVINFGVIVPRLYQGRNVAAPFHTECHWGCRVRDKERHERWFSVRERDSSDDLAREMIQIIEADVVPVLATKQKEADLIEAWMTGHGSGSSRIKKLEYVGLLLHHAGRFEELATVKKTLMETARTPYEVGTLRVLEALEVPPSQ